MWIGLLGLALAVATPSGAAPLVPCAARPDPSSQFCADPDLIRLDRDIAARLDAAVRTMRDPLAAALLSNERILRQAVPVLVEGEALMDRYPGGVRVIRESLQREKDLLSAMGRPNPRGLAGTWVNAFAALRVEASGPGRYQVTATRRWAERPSPGDDDLAIASCEIRLEVRRRSDGWYTTDGVALDAERSGVRRQGISLRLALGTDAEVGRRCGRHDAMTGTYFRLNTGEEVGPMHGDAPVRPSFACDRSASGVTGEICADPELAELDRRLADTYADALKRLDRETAGFLKADQMTWLALRADVHDDALSPVSEKAMLPKDGFGIARRMMVDWTRQRIDRLAAVTPRAADAEGDWMSARGRGRLRHGDDGALIFSGEKASFVYHGGDCSYDVALKLERGIARSQARSEDGIRIQPEIWTDGRTLRVDPGMSKALADWMAHPSDDGAVRPVPDYCTKLFTADDRLFPVRPGLR